MARLFLSRRPPRALTRRDRSARRPLVIVGRMDRELTSRAVAPTARLEALGILILFLLEYYFALLLAQCYLVVDLFLALAVLFISLEDNQSCF